MIHYCDIRNPQ